MHPKVRKLPESAYWAVSGSSREAPAAGLPMAHVFNSQGPRVLCRP